MAKRSSQRARIRRKRGHRERVRPGALPMQRRRRPDRGEGVAALAGVRTPEVISAIEADDRYSNPPCVERYDTVVLS